MGKFFVSCVLALFAPQANAGWLVEPYLGYETGTINQKDTANLDLSGKTAGPSVGLRLGYKFSRGIWMTVDHMSMFGGKFTYNDPVNGTTSKTNKNDLGVTLGYDHHGKFRFYLGYVIEPVFRTVDEAIGGQENIYTTGASYKVGIGGLWGNYFTFSFEYYSNTPTKYRNEGGTFSVSDINNTYVETGYRLVTSFPLNLTK